MGDAALPIGGIQPRHASPAAHHGRARGGAPAAPAARLVGAAAERAAHARGAARRLPHHQGSRDGLPADAVRPRPRHPQDGGARREGPRRVRRHADRLRHRHPARQPGGVRASAVLRHPQVCAAGRQEAGAALPPIPRRDLPAGGRGHQAQLPAGGSGARLKGGGAAALQLDGGDGGARGTDCRARPRDQPARQARLPHRGGRAARHAGHGHQQPQYRADGARDSADGRRRGQLAAPRPADAAGGQLPAPPRRGLPRHRQATRQRPRHARLYGAALRAAGADRRLRESHRGRGRPRRARPRRGLGGSGGRGGGDGPSARARLPPAHALLCTAERRHGGQRRGGDAGRRRALRLGPAPACRVRRRARRAVPRRLPRARRDHRLLPRAGVRRRPLRPRACGRLPARARERRLRHPRRRRPRHRVQPRRRALDDRRHGHSDGRQEGGPPAGGAAALRGGFRDGGRRRIRVQCAGADLLRRLGRGSRARATAAAPRQEGL
mmetsp:Transcript_35771/g.117699  ORF Transcript_35771/g.117699 Transcript_35771/m.117699 type:complete len:496 (+) Transcript_35771:1521-3008(+)